MTSGGGWLPRCPCNLALLWDSSWFLRGRYDAGEGAFYGVCQPECYISGRGPPLPISRLQLVNPSRLPPCDPCLPKGVIACRVSTLTKGLCNFKQTLTSSSLQLLLLLYLRLIVCHFLQVRLLWSFI